jgi:hypothetical protein
MSRPANWPEGIPYLDTSVQHVGTSWLRTADADSLLRLTGLVVIGAGTTPLAVLMPYKTYIKMQEGKQ